MIKELLDGIFRKRSFAFKILVGGGNTYEAFR